MFVLCLNSFCFSLLYILKVPGKYLQYYIDVWKDSILSSTVNCRGKSDDFLAYNTFCFLKYISSSTLVKKIVYQEQPILSKFNFARRSSNPGLRSVIMSLFKLYSSLVSNTYIKLTFFWYSLYTLYWSMWIQLDLDS